MWNLIPTKPTKRTAFWLQHMFAADSTGKLFQKLDAMIALRPTAPDPNNDRPMCVVLSKFPDQSCGKQWDTTLKLRRSQLGPKDLHAAIASASAPEPSVLRIRCSSMPAGWC